MLAREGARKALRDESSAAQRCAVRVPVQVGLRDWKSDCQAANNNLVTRCDDLPPRKLVQLE